MSNIYESIFIGKPITEVFSFVTTPENWLDWHPSSISVNGDIDHPLETGEQVTEEFLVAGKTGQVSWKVIEKRFPDHWLISGDVVGAGAGIIKYRLSGESGGTRFERIFTYKMANWLLALMDKVFIRRRIQTESRQALNCLKVIMEGDSREIETRKNELKLSDSHHS